MWTARCPNLDRLVEMYTGGMSLRTLVTETGMAYGTVHRRLVDAGVTMRPRGGHNPRIKA